MVVEGIGARVDPRLRRFIYIYNLDTSIIHTNTREFWEPKGRSSLEYI